MIDGVVVQKLMQISDERGKVMHMMRSDSELFKRFGEIYFSVINPGVVKAWKRHLEMTQHFAVPVGSIRLVIYDSRDDSATSGSIMDLKIGEDNYSIVRVPPLVCYGFKNISSVSSLIANCTDLPHSPDEAEQIGFDDRSIPFDWKTN